MCVVNRAQSLPPTVSPHRHHPLLFSVLRDSIHSRDLGNPANELSPTISPHREDHPPPFRGWRGTKSGLLGIRNSLDRRQGDLYKGTIPRRNHSSLRDSIHYASSSLDAAFFLFEGGAGVTRSWTCSGSDRVRLFSRGVLTAKAAAMSICPSGRVVIAAYRTMCAAGGGF